MKPSILYTIIISAIFLALAAIMLFFPRSTYSELEKRDLATFPEFSPEKLHGAKYTSEISGWFSDTEPFRDYFMATSMKVRDALRFTFRPDDEAVTFQATDTPPGDTSAESDINDMGEYKNKVTANEEAKIASSGIIIVGKAPKVRALNAFGGSADGGTQFAAAVSQYAGELHGVKVYAMVIPLSSEFYMPESAKKKSRPQLPTIKNIYSHLGNGARGVNAYGALADHVEEDIYLRTDHHWAALGAYYAAKEFAASAGVPFKDLSTYDKHIVKRFVGSMYGYSKNISVKESPENFIYYTPRGVDYGVTYRNYTLNKKYEVTNESAPQKGPFFYKYNDGNGGAYSTFMGSDKRLTHIHTNVKNGRRLAIIKDSYGNALPPFLFHSFEDIHVIDFRYFTHNLKKYVADNKITDLVFCVNIFNAYSSSVPAKLKRFLTQGDNSFAAPTPSEPEKEKENVKKREESKPEQHQDPEVAPAAPAFEPEAPAPSPASPSEPASPADPTSPREPDAAIKSAT